MPASYKYKPFHFSQVYQMKRVSLPSTVPLYTIVFSLLKVVNMGQVQLLFVVLCLAVAMAITQPDVRNQPRKLGEKGQIRPLRASVSERHTSLLRDVQAKVAELRRTQVVMEIRQVDMGARIEETRSRQVKMEARQVEMQSQQKEIQLRQKAMEIKQVSSVALLNSLFELVRNVSGKQLWCPQSFQPNYSLKSCYYFSETKLNWYQARQRCLEMQGYLVEVESKEEDDFIKATIAARGSPNHWLGGSDALQEGVFRWSHSGRAFTYTNWYRGQPDNSANLEDCVVTWADATWNDGQCGFTTYFICEAN